MFLSWGLGTRHVERIGIEVVCDGVVCSVRKTVFSGVCCDLWFRNKYSSMRREEQSRRDGRGRGPRGRQD